MIVFVEGTSFIPNKGIHIQKIPAITSVSDNKVNSAAGITFEPIEYKIRPIQTKTPCNENNPPLQLEDKKFNPLFIIKIDEIIIQKKPAQATVVNLGVSFFHLNETVKTEKPIDDARPNINPNKELFSSFPREIMTNPIVAIKIAIQTFKEIFSFKNKNPNSAVKKGIAAKQSNVIAAEVLVIE